ncbi:hypothetical protein LCGC14_2211990 [marine sediment metagenome]|uniref:Uncharacterized protein n=1 Tax=marine sediment metagenome TaxID=412755 RepID=A0A0F9G976_9ZZZZ
MKYWTIRGVLSSGEEPTSPFDAETIEEVQEQIKLDNSYDDKRVEAVGADWVVAREINSGKVFFHNEAPELLEEYTEPVN